MGDSTATRGGDDWFPLMRDAEIGGIVVYKKTVLCGTILLEQSKEKFTSDPLPPAPHTHFVWNVAIGSPRKAGPVYIRLFNHIT